MAFDRVYSKRLQMADTMRATMLGLVLRTVGDDVLELVEGAAPPEQQRLDFATWITPPEIAAGLEDKLSTLINEIEARLAELGVRGMIYLASDMSLLDERLETQGRLYGTSRHDRDEQHPGSDQA